MGGREGLDFRSFLGRWEINRLRIGDGEKGMGLVLILLFSCPAHRFYSFKHHNLFSTIELAE